MSSASTDMHVMPSNLLPGDCARLEAFMRVGSDRLHRRWSIGMGPQVKLLIFSGEGPETIPGLLDASPRLVRVIDDGEPHAADMPVLRRPIDFEAFVDLMVAAEEAQQRRESWVAAQAQTQVPMPAPVTAPVPVAVPAAAPSPARPTATEPASQPPEAGQAAAPVAPVALEGPAAARARLTLDDLVRLRRWPQASLLQDWRYGIRMSSFMSTRFVTVRELAKLSNVGEAETARFVDALHAAGLVRLRDEPAATAPAGGRLPVAAPASPATALAQPPAAARLGLLARLRQKLGLGPGGAPT